MRNAVGVEWTKDDTHYELNPDVDYPREIAEYVGPASDWNTRVVTDEVDLWEILVDLMLYMDNDDLLDLTKRFEESSLDVADTAMEMGSMLDVKDNSGSRHVAINLIKYVWWANHHWGNLVGSKTTDKEYVEGYLFRFLHGLSQFKNPIDMRQYLETPHEVYACGELILKQNKHVMGDDLTLARYIANEGFAERDYLYDALMDYKGDLEQTAPNVVENMTMYLQNHFKKQVKSIDDWGQLLKICQEKR